MSTPRFQHFTCDFIIEVTPDNYFEWCLIVTEESLEKATIMVEEHVARWRATATIYEIVLQRISDERSELFHVQNHAGVRNLAEPREIVVIQERSLADKAKKFLHFKRPALIFALLLILFLTSCATALHGGSSGDTVTLPADFTYVLRDYETAWRAKDAAALACLFAEDGFVLTPGRPPVRGREAIQHAYTGAGGPLYLTALAWAKEGSTGYIIGAFTHKPDATAEESGKFTLTLKKAAGMNGRWVIVSDMDNGNRRPQ